MTHLEIEIKRLKQEVIEMNEIILLQMKKAQQSFMVFDKELAREVNFNERRVNALELKIDKDCENIFALFNPVAVDLRFVLASLKINYNLERIGDIADGIARYVMEAREPFDKLLLNVTRINEMFDMAIIMLEDIKRAFEFEDSKIARTVFQKDDLLDLINAAASSAIENYIKGHPDAIAPALHIISTIRKTGTHGRPG